MSTARVFRFIIGVIVSAIVLSLVLLAVSVLVLAALRDRWVTGTVR